MSGPTYSLQPPSAQQQTPTGTRNEFACCDQKFGSCKEVMHHMSTRHVLGRENRRGQQNANAMEPQGPIHLHKRLPPNEQTGAPANITVTVSRNAAPAAPGGEYRYLQNPPAVPPPGAHPIQQPHPSFYLTHNNPYPPTHFRQPEDESGSSFDGSSKDGSLPSSSVSPQIPLYHPSTTSSHAVPTQTISFLNDEYDVDAFLGLTNSGDGGLDTLAGLDMGSRGGHDQNQENNDLFLKDEALDSFPSDNTLFTFTFTNPQYPATFDPSLRRRSMSAPPMGSGLTLHDFQLAVQQAGMQEMEMDDGLDVGGLVGGPEHGQLDAGVNMAMVLGLDHSGMEMDLGLTDLGVELNQALGLEETSDVGSGRSSVARPGAQGTVGVGDNFGLTPSPVLSTATGGSLQSPYAAPSPLAVPQSPHTLPRATGSAQLGYPQTAQVYGQQHTGKLVLDSMDLAVPRAQPYAQPQPTLMHMSVHSKLPPSPATLPRANSRKRRQSTVDLAPPPLRPPTPSSQHQQQYQPQPYISIPHHPHPRVNHLISSHAPPSQLQQQPQQQQPYSPYPPFLSTPADIQRSPSPAPSVMSDGGVHLGLPTDWGSSSPTQYAIAPQHLHVPQIPPRPASSLGFVREGGRWGGTSTPETIRAERDKTTGEKIYRCPKPWCSKVYKNANGLKYHLDKGVCEVDADSNASEAGSPVIRPSSPLIGGGEFGSPQMGFASGMGMEGVGMPMGVQVKIAHRPYWCRVAGCGKKYKNLNGLKYHARAAHPMMDFKEEVKGLGAS
ncbi:Transcriptional regulator of ribosomal biogenesis proteins [Rhizophlyctis rosea]|uniref:Transcriptional regulator of ribosomal biogenesis proteins n=1 Tax=Rhizophlyctis rosea TaxID=64517 RepID=A0AAD5X6A8_9FUNG|nr:Transcriptional regulator of ribosomal biogenesis proteins [Rhizophlyctis rosea]